MSCSAPPKVACVALLREQRPRRGAGSGMFVLLLRRSPSNPIGPCAWHLPGGKAEAAEAIEAAAQREVKEELGVAVGALRVCGSTSRGDAAAETVKAESPELHLFMVTEWCGKPFAREPGTEIAWVDVDRMHEYKPALPSLAINQEALQSELSVRRQRRERDVAAGRVAWRARSCWRSHFADDEDEMPDLRDASESDDEEVQALEHLCGSVRLVQKGNTRPRSTSSEGNTLTPPD